MTSPGDLPFVDSQRILSPGSAAMKTRRPPDSREHRTMLESLRFVARP
jgi:hypothetical protein